MVWMAAKLNSGEQKGNSCDFFVAVVATLLSAPLTDFTIWFMNWKKKEKNCRMIKIDSNKLKRHAMYSILFLRFLDQNTESMCDIWAIASYDFPLLPNRKGKKNWIFSDKIQPFLVLLFIFVKYHVYSYPSVYISFTNYIILWWRKGAFFQETSDYSKLNEQTRRFSLWNNDTSSRLK